MPTFAKKNDHTEKIGGSIIFIESTLPFQEEFENNNTDMSLSDEYTFENLIDNYRKNYQKNNKDEVSLYLWGSALHSLKRYKEAIDKFNEATNIKPDYYDVYASWAETLLKMGNYAEAVEYYEKASNSISGDANIYFNWGNALYLIGKFADAEQKYRQALELTSSNIACCNNLSASLFYQGKYNDAYEILLKAQKINSDNPTIYLSQANCLVKMNETKKAKKLFEKALDYDKENPKVFIGLANLFYMMKNYEDAVIYYKKALKHIEDNPYLYNNVGVSYFKIGSVETAEDYFKKSLMFTTDEKSISDVYANLANVYIEKDDYETAIQYLEKYAKANNFSLYSKTRLTKAYAYSGDYQQAIKTFTEILEGIGTQYTNAENAENEQGIDFIDLMQFMSEYIDMYSEKTDLNPLEIEELINAYHRMSELFYNFGMLNESLASLNNIDRLSENNPQSMMLRGKILFEQNEQDKAINYLEKALSKIDNAENSVYRILVEYQLTHRKVKEAFETIKKLENSSPDGYLTYLLYGMAFNEISDYINAETNYTKAIRVEPDNPEPKVWLGKMYLKMNEYEKSIDLLKHVTETISSPDAYFNLAKAYKHINKIKLAIQSYKRAIALDRNNPDYRIELSELLSELEEYNEVISLFNSVEDRLTSAEAKLLANAFIYEKQYENAINVLGNMSKDTEEVETQYLIGFVEYKVQNYDKAKKAFSKALSINNKHSQALETMAHLHFECENYNEAYLYYKKLFEVKAVEYVESDTQLCKRFAICCYHKGSYDKAIEYINKVLKLSRVDYENYYYMGLALMKKDDLHGAVENLLTATELKTNFVEGYLELGKIFTMIGSYNEAVAIFEKASEFPHYESVKNKEEVLDNKEYWATALAELGEYDNSCYVMESILEASPSRPSVLLKYAELESRIGNIEKAITKYKDILNADSKNFEACLGLADAFYSIDNYAKASQYYSMCNQLQNNNRECLYKYALSLYHLDSYNEALPPLKRILINNEEDEQALLLSGKIFLARMLLKEAISSFEKYNSLAGDNVESDYLLGIAHYLSRNYERAIEILGELGEMNYTHYFAYFILAMSYYSLGDTKSALEYFNHSVNIEPNFVQAYYYIGIINYEAERYDEAISCFNRSQCVNEFTGDSLFYKLCCIIQSDRLDEAQSLVSNVSEYFDDRENILAIGGLLSLINDDTDNARTYLKKLNIVNPNSNSIQYYFSVLHRMSNNFKEAEKYLNKEYQRRKNDPELIYEMALIQIEKKDFAEANRYLKQCIDTDPNFFKAYLLLGTISMEAQNHDSARRYFEKALTLEPNSKKTMWQSALNEYSVKRYEQAYKLFQGVLPKSGSDEEYLVLYYIGMCKYHLSDVIVAREFFGQSLESKGKYYDSLYMYGKCCFDLSLSDEGYKYYSLASEVDPTSYELFIEWANKLIEDGRFDDALPVLERAKASNKTEEEPYKLSAYIYDAKNELEKAISEYSKVINLNENDFEMLIKYADVLNQTGEHADAVEMYNKALKIKQPEPAIMIGYVDALIKARIYDDAENTLLKLIDRTNDGLYNAHQLLGIAKTRLGKYIEAIECFVKSESNNETSPEMLSCWAFSLYKSGEYNEALDKYNHLIETGKANDDDYFYAGESAYKQQKYHIASSYYSEIVSRNADYDRVYIPYADVLLKLKQKEQAFEMLSLGEEKNPTNFELYVFWGKTLYDLREYSEALDKFNKASALNSDDFTPHIYKARIFKHLGKLNTAEKEYRNYLLTDPNNLECMMGLSELLIDREHYDEVIGILKHAMSIDDKNIQSIAYLAFAYHRRGEFAQAESYYSKLYEIRPDSIEVNLNYANLLFDDKKFQQAKPKYEYVLKIDNSNTVAIFKLGIIDYYLGEYDSAEKSLIKSKSMGENDPLLFEYLGRINFKKQNFKGAYAYFLRALEFKEDYSLYEMCAECAYRIEEFEEGFKLFEKAVSLNKNTKLIKKWANHLLDVEEYENAYVIINKLEINPSNHAKSLIDKELYKVKGEVLYHIGEKEQALPLLLEYRNHDKDDVETIKYLAYIYHDLKMYEDALSVSENTIKENIYDKDLLLLASKINRELGELTKSMDYCERLITNDAGDAEINKEYSEVLIESGEVIKGIEHLEKALARTPDKALIIRLSELYLETEDFKSAHQLLKENIEDYPADYEMHLVFGRCLHKQKKYDEALDEFYKAYVLNESNLDTILYIARANAVLGNYEEMNKYFESAVGLDSNNVYIYAEWANILYEALETQEALRIIDKALIYNPDNDKALEVKAKILFDLSMYDEAVSIYSMLEISEDSNYDTLKKYALSLKHSGRVKEAISIFALFDTDKDFEPRLYAEYMQALLSEDMYSRIIQLYETDALKSSYDARIRQIAGDAYFAQEDYYNASMCYQFALKANLINTDLFYKLSVSLYHQGKFGDAKQMIQRAINQDKLNYLYHYQLGLCNFEMGFRFDAIDDFQNSITYNPEFYEAYFNLGCLYFSLQKVEEGNEAFEKARLINSDDFALYKEWALNLLSIDKAELALDKIEIALSLSKENDLKHIKADILMMLSQYQEASHLYKHLLKTDSINLAEKEEHKLIIKLSRAYYFLKEYGKAYRNLEGIKSSNETNNAFITLFGKVALSLGYNTIARQYLSKAITLNPNNIGMYENYGDALFNLSQYDEAIDMFKKALLLEDKHLLKFKLGLCYYNIKKYEEAVWSFETYLTFSKRNEDALYYYAMSLIKLKQKENAIVVLEKLVDINPLYKNAVYKLSESYYQTGRNRDCIRVFAENEYMCKSYKFYYEWGMKHRILGEYEKALSCFTEAIGYDKDNPEAMYRKAEILLELSRINEALDVTAGILAYNPDDFTANLKYADALSRADKNKEAINVFEKCYQINPLHYDLLIKYGLASYRTGDFVKAREMFTEAIRIKENEPKAYVLLGKVLFELNELDEAILKFKSAIKINHNYSDAYIEWGNCLFTNKKYNEAIIKYNKALSQEPGKHSLYKSIAIAYYKVKNYEEAEKYLEALVKHNGDIDALFMLAEAKKALGKTDEAIEYFNALTNQKKYEFNARSSLAELYTKEGQLSKAVVEYKLLVANHECPLKVYIQYAKALIQSEKYYEAYHLLSPIVDNDGVKNSELRYLFATCAWEMGEEAKAVSNLKKVLKLEPESVQILEKLLDFMLKLNEYEEARSYLDSILKLEPNNIKAQRRKAELLIKEGKVHQAKIFVKNIIEVNKNNGDAHRMLGYIYVSEKDYEKALLNFQKALLLNPGDIASTYESAVIHFKTREYAKAEEKFKSVINKYDASTDWEMKQNIDILEVHSLLGSIYNEWEYYDKALKEFDLVRKMALSNNKKYDSKSSNLFYVENMIKLIQKNKNQFMDKDIEKTPKDIEKHIDNESENDYYLESVNNANKKHDDEQTGTTSENKNTINQTDEQDIERDTTTQRTVSDGQTLYLQNLKSKLEHISDTIEDSTAEEDDRKKLRKIVSSFSKHILDTDLTMTTIDIEELLTVSMNGSPLLEGIEKMVHISDAGMVNFYAEPMKTVFDMILDYVGLFVQDGSLLILTNENEDYGREISIKLVNGKDINQNNGSKSRHLLNSFSEDSIYIKLVKSVLEEIPSLLSVNRKENEYNITLIFPNEES